VRECVRPGEFATRNVTFVIRMRAVSAPAAEFRAREEASNSIALEAWSLPFTDSPMRPRSRRRIAYPSCRRSLSSDAALYPFSTSKNEPDDAR